MTAMVRRADVVDGSPMSGDPLEADWPPHRGKLIKWAISRLLRRDKWVSHSVSSSAISNRLRG